MMVKTFIDEIREEGLREGRLEGLTNSIYTSIERYIDNRFYELPSFLKDKIESISDYPSLEEIQFFIWNCKSLDEVNQFVDRIIDSLKAR